jgi:hypothetical protein
VDRVSYYARRNMIREQYTCFPVHPCWATPPHSLSRIAACSCSKVTQVPPNPEAASVLSRIPHNESACLKWIAPVRFVVTCCNHGRYTMYFNIIL